MAERKLQLVAAMIRSVSPPATTNVLWGKIIDPIQPERIEVSYFNVAQNAWLPLRSPEFYADPVVSRTDEPPGSAIVGSRYLLSAEPTGIYAAYPHHVAVREATGWKFIPPRDGVSLVVLDQNRSYLAQGAAFSAMAGGAGSAAGAYFVELQGLPRSNNNLATALDDSRDAAVALVQGGVDASYDTLAKLYALVSSLQGTALKPPLAFDAANATTFPAGGPEAGDSYLVSSSGTVQGVALNPQDFIFTSLPDAAAVAADWDVIPGVAGLATDTVTGIVRLATLPEAETETGGAAMTAARMAAWRSAVLGSAAAFETYLRGQEVAAPSTLLEDIASRIASHLATQTSAAQIFVTDARSVSPAKVVEKTLDPQAVGQQIVTALATNDNQVDVSLLIYGGTQWSPEYLANGVAVSLTRLPDQHAFTGSVRLPVNPATDQITITGNGASVAVALSPLGDAPAIQSITYGAYPTGPNGVLQTEVKTGDQLEVTLELETTQGLDSLVVAAAGAFVAQTVPVTIVNATQARATLTVGHAHSAAAAADLGISLRSRLANGTQGESYTEATGVSANNYAGTLNLSSISYPAGQQAVKDSEAVTLALSYADIDSLLVDSLQFTVNDPAVLDVTKTLLLNQAGRDAGYKVSGSNVVLSAVRNANGATINRTELVKIAHQDVALSEDPLVTLRESGVISVNLTQDVDTLVVSGVPVGTPGTLTEIDVENYQLAVAIADSDARSASTLTLSLEATNLAARVVTLSRSYRVTGFSARSLQLTYDALTAPLPVNVVDPSRVILSGQINASPAFPLLNMEYDPALDQVNDFNISGGNLVLSALTYDFGYDTGVTIDITIEETA